MAPFLLEYLNARHFTPSPGSFTRGTWRQVHEGARAASDAAASASSLWLVASAAGRCGGWMLELNVPEHELALYRALHAPNRDERLHALSALRAAATDATAVQLVARRLGAPR